MHFSPNGDLSVIFNEKGELTSIRNRRLANGKPVLFVFDVIYEGSSFKGWVVSIIDPRTEEPEKLRFQVKSLSEVIVEQAPLKFKKFSTQNGMKIHVPGEENIYHEYEDGNFHQIIDSKATDQIESLLHELYGN